MNRIAIAALPALLFASAAHADVNMLEASFRTTFIDAEISGLKIQRRYDSHSNVVGLFGFGWCSSLDVQLDTKTLSIKDCGKISRASLRYDDGAYVQTLAGGLTRTFDADSGSLLAIRSGRGPTIAIERASAAGPSDGPRSRLPRAAALGEGLKMRLEYDPLGETVTAIELPDGKRLEFTYDGERNLLSAKNAWSNTYRFEYDSLHNLVRTSYPDRTFERLTYEPDRDRLLTYQGRDGCIETYEHTLTASAHTRLQTSSARLTCNGRLKRQAVFRFGFSLSPSATTRKPGAWKLTAFERGTK